MVRDSDPLRDDGQCWQAGTCYERISLVGSVPGYLAAELPPSDDIQYR